MLEVLRDYQTRKRKQILNLMEEQQHLHQSSNALRHLWNMGAGIENLCEARKLEAKRNPIVYEWLPVCDLQDKVLCGLIAHLEFIQSRKAGRMPRLATDVDENLSRLEHIAPDCYLMVQQNRPKAHAYS
jgi:hypothetical protein